MRTKRTKRIKAFLKNLTGAAKLALVLVLLLRITIPGAALCLQDNGGVSVESYVNGLCTYSLAAAYEPGDDNFSSIECASKTHRFECVDIPLSEKLKEKKADTQNDLDAQMSAHTLAVTVAYAAPRPPVSTEKIPIPSGRSKAETKALIKSTVLVC